MFIILGSNSIENYSLSVTNFGQSSISQKNLIYQKTLSWYTWHIEGFALVFYFPLLCVCDSRLCPVTVVRIGQESCSFEGDAK